MNTIIGKNLKLFREFNKFSQEQVAQFLSIKRSAYGNYEAGERETPLSVLEKCAALYGCDLSLFFEKDKNNVEDMLLCTFRVDNVSALDMEEIARFKNIVKSYLKLAKISAHGSSVV